MSSEIRLEMNGSVCRIVLNAPSRRNALRPDMLAALQGAVQAAQDAGNAARVVVLQAEGPVFCAGFDLKQCAAEDGVLESLLEGLAEVITGLRNIGVPTIAAVRGAAVAGGCALLGGADFVIAHPETKLGYPVLRIGVSPAVSGPSLSQAVGAGGARRLLLDPSLISAPRAEALGLLHELSPDPESAAETLAANLAGKPGGGVAATRRWLDELVPLDRQPAALAASLRITRTPERRRMLDDVWSSR